MDALDPIVDSLSVKSPDFQKLLPVNRIQTDINRVFKDFLCQRHAKQFVFQKPVKVLVGDFNDMRCRVFVIGAIVVLGFGPLMTDLSPFDQGAGWLGILDTLTNSILMPIVAILTCLFIGFVVKVSFITEEVESEGNAFMFKRPFEYMIKYICPICLAAILIFGTLDMFGIFSVY